MREIHEMKLTGRLASGADEWSCPTCGRRIALRRPPDPELTVLDPGDQNAVHVGLIEPNPAAAAAAEKYGLGPVQEIPRPPRPAEPAAPDDDDRRWLAEIGIDWDGGAAA
ncbi:hypothetical protein GCM10010193_54550 [Kitasatospora atroaurantiaca]|uniref:Uncharacterized protein n=1 Tax=Kitasatospora atroaurantiaca TaxID=285545 RepID=A0A561EPW1_9ACTN|nr:hypothetical protein [Kitasatospora atroaurantiaca]TWE17656.1 hypothetical protein FB465_2694 [Kitasatospora atroaurantiaca]